MKHSLFVWCAVLAVALCAPGAAAQSRVSGAPVPPPPRLSPPPAPAPAAADTKTIPPVSYTHLTLPTNREV